MLVPLTDKWIQRTLELYPQACPHPNTSTTAHQAKGGVFASLAAFWQSDDTTANEIDLSSELAAFVPTGAVK